MIDEEAIKLHVAPSGEVWRTDGCETPHAVGVDAREFLQTLPPQPDRTIRLLGVPRNAPLIAGLFERRAALSLRRIELAGPQVCDTLTELDDPERTLFRMRQCLLPSHCGGWHVLTELEYPAYAHVTAEDDRWLQRHPAWSAVSFIGGVNPTAVATLLRQLLDPRWHVSPLHPDRSGRLRTFLGLMPRSAASGCSRYRLVRDTWKSDNPGAAIERPEYFLWRRSLETDDLRACHKFASFLRYTWLDALQRRPGGADLFDPQQFFARDDECKAYAAHLRRISSPV